MPLELFLRGLTRVGFWYAATTAMNWRGTTIRDWLLLAVSVAFVVVSLVLLVAGGHGTAPLATFAFFGMCSVVAIHSVRAKLRMHTLRNDRSATLFVTGGAPLVASRARAIGLSLGIAALGAFLTITGESIGAEFVVVSVLMAGLGAAMLVAFALGMGQRPTLTFTPEGLRFDGDTITYLAPWDAIDVRLLTVQDQPFVGLWLRDPARVVSTAQVRVADTVTERAKLSQRIEKSLRWNGLHLTLSAPAYGVETLPLMRAMQRYIDQPEARAELR